MFALQVFLEGSSIEYDQQSLGNVDRYSWGLINRSGTAQIHVVDAIAPVHWHPVLTAECASEGGVRGCRVLGGSGAGDVYGTTPPRSVAPHPRRAGVVPSLLRLSAVPRRQRRQTIPPGALPSCALTNLSNQSLQSKVGFQPEYLVSAPANADSVPSSFNHIAH